MNEAVNNTNNPTVQLEGMDIYITIPGGQTCGSFSVVEYQLEASTLGAPLHVHQNEDVYIYVTSGELIVQVAGNVNSVRHGLWFHIPRGTLHALWSGKSSAVRYLELANPAGAEQSYLELASILAASAPLEFEAIQALEARYGIQTDFQSIFELTEVHGLRFDQRYQAICW